MKSVESEAVSQEKSVTAWGTICGLFSHMKSKLRRGLLRLFLSVFKRIPLTNTIVFECESDMADNPFAFFSFLVKNGFHECHKIVWLVKNVE